MLLPSAVISHTTGGGGFASNGLNFYNSGSGANYLTIGALTGVVDGSIGSLSLWARFDGGDSALLPMKRQNTPYVDFYRDTDGHVQFRLFNAAQSSTYQMVSNPSIAIGSNWHHFLVSWNTNFSAGNKIGNFYMDDTNILSSTSDVFGAFNVGYTSDVNSFPLSTGNDQISLSEIWYAPGQFIDFSNSANRALFSSGGHPISLGATGNLPTGTAPAVYLHNAAATSGTNSGTGGNFTIQGTITDTTHP